MRVELALFGVGLVAVALADDLQRRLGRHDGGRAVAKQPDDPDLDPIDGLDQLVLDHAVLGQLLQVVVAGLGGVELQVGGHDGHLEAARHRRGEIARQGVAGPLELVVAQGGGVVAQLLHQGKGGRLGVAEEAEQRAHGPVAGVEQQDAGGAGGGFLCRDLRRQAGEATHGGVVALRVGREVCDRGVPHQVVVHVGGLQDHQLLCRRCRRVRAHVRASLTRRHVRCGVGFRAEVVLLHLGVVRASREAEHQRQGQRPDPHVSSPHPNHRLSPPLLGRRGSPAGPEFYQALDCWGAAYACGLGASSSPGP